MRLLTKIWTVLAVQAAKAAEAAETAEINTVTYCSHSFADPLASTSQPQLRLQGKRGGARRRAPNAIFWDTEQALDDAHNVVTARGCRPLLRRLFRFHWGREAERMSWKRGQGREPRNSGGHAGIERRRVRECLRRNLHKLSYQYDQGGVHCLTVPPVTL